MRKKQRWIILERKKVSGNISTYGIKWCCCYQVLFFTFPQNKRMVAGTKRWLQAVRMGKLVKNLPVLLWLLKNLYCLEGLILLICCICDFCIFQISGLLILRLPEVNNCYEQCWCTSCFVSREKGHGASSVIQFLVTFSQW